MLALAAVLLQLGPLGPLAPAQDPGEEPYFPAKIRPSLSMKVVPKADATKPFRFTMSGKLQRNGVDQFAACRGRVGIRIRRGDITVGKGRVTVDPECRYSRTVTISTSKLPSKERSGGVLRITGRFQGNAALQPDSAPQRKATFGTAAR